MSKYKIITPKRLNGERVDFAISQMLPEISRSKITSVIKEKNTQIDGKSFKAKDRIKGCEIIDFNYEEKVATNWVPSDITLDIVFEDDDIMVINKPAGLITHPGNGNPEGTLANALLHYNKNLEKVDRVGIVHRLDKETSGLLVVAKNNIVAKNLIEQLRERTVSREYNAIVYGHMIAGGTIDEPIGRDSRNRVKQAVNEFGKEAITHYRVIQKFKDFTLVKAILETGRTHQIRVHLTHLGYPLVGDKMYGAKLRFPKGASENLKSNLKEFTRQALHAKKLSFIHPITNENMSFKSPIPADMQNLLDIFTNENA
jgi:23S rRNA pseudouridine1911/1915/1917 synthase